MDLADRVAVITGASSGIGEATARALASAGAAVVLVARRRDRLEALASGIEDAGGRAVVEAADVTDAPALRAVAERAVDALGGIDILVNNAGIMLLSPLERLRLDDWHRMVDVNIKGVLNGVAAVLPAMKARGGGHIVNVGSVAGRRPFPTGAVYSATKFAVRALSAGLRLELSPADGIRVTDIQPGVVETELADHIPDAAARETFDARWAGKRKLRAEDIARAVVYVVTQPDRVNVNELLVRPTDQET